ncbi:MAG: response regulator [Rhodospirillales bacterium]|nr:response regulator [Rhodospirillales bacterium]MBN8905178.1 response regulator [Rhodospirillales bacterium]MBN8926602.1 response regulator [Rhodospirillales bacterium]
MPVANASALQPEPPTILMVEDEPVLLETIAECLRDWGYTVLEAPNATEAIAQLATVEHVDLIFSDIRMPGRMDGFALARWVRARHPEIRILLTTGYEGQSRPEDSGLSDAPILRKPYELGVLRTRVADLVMLRSARS